MSWIWTSDGVWWIALLVQLLSIPGSFLPLLPGLIWLPVGALVWMGAVGWTQAWPEFVLALVLFGLGLIADLLALGLASARLKASRWSAAGAGVGLLVGVLGLLPVLARVGARSRQRPTEYPDADGEHVAAPRRGRHDATNHLALCQPC